MASARTDGTVCLLAGAVVPELRDRRGSSRSFVFPKNRKEVEEYLAVPWDGGRSWPDLPRIFLCKARRRDLCHCHSQHFPLRYALHV